MIANCEAAPQAIDASSAQTPDTGPAERYYPMRARLPPSRRGDDEVVRLLRVDEARAEGRGLGRRRLEEDVAVNLRLRCGWGVDEAGERYCC